MTNINRLKAAGTLEHAQARTTETVETPALAVEDLGKAMAADVESDPDTVVDALFAIADAIDHLAEAVRRMGSPLETPDTED